MKTMTTMVATEKDPQKEKGKGRVKKEKTLQKTMNKATGMEGREPEDRALRESQQKNGKTRCQ